ncbi:5-oxoprolinase subunit PxpA [Botrimarina mediterranea]|uniref:LamB/YcsF family protein n=1 Tax=Botrimarina mediterranea TaxID=2528022 RepID=A0A518KBV8_9BACT|nr:5-oxoprolinase subunit PxpA [Botrimarina mediterranea]QDV75281.1 LamB/YcsF family protein [Botrimarina mediterranea]
MRTIDLNADVGEGLATDAELISLVTSANIACGGHAGDENAIHDSVIAAIEGGVAIGAHPGHADRQHFGRREIAVTPGALAALVDEQIETLHFYAFTLTGWTLKYLKLHGALYHQTGRDRSLADAVIAAASRYTFGPLPILGQAGSALEAAAKDAGLPFFAEAFADRAYRDDGTLAPRSLPGAVLTDEAAVVAQAVRLARDGVAVALSGKEIPMRSDSICLHGDGENAVPLARAVRAALEAEGITLRAFTTQGDTE